MIFKIVDGRPNFYQWDIDRQIEVADPTIKEVHFCNRTEDCSLVVGVKDGIANVPNKVLQNGYPVRVFGYDGKATLHEATFEVKARTRPADYVYTEEQEYTIEAYIERAVEEAKATGNFQGDTGPKGDKGDKGDTGEPFTYDMFTEEQLEALRGPEGKQGLTGPRGEKGEKGDQGIQGIPGETPSLEGYATEKYVNEALANIDISEVGELNNVVIINKTTTDGNRIQDLLDAGKWPILVYTDQYYPYMYQGDNKYYFGIKSESLEELYYYDTKEKWWYYITNEYYTKEEVNELIPEGADLSNYYTKSEVDGLIPDTSKFITEVPAEYITETELNNKGYLTAHQSLSNYYTKEEANKAIQDALSAIGVAEGGAY